MPEATYRNGDYVRVDYTPGGAVAAGEVIPNAVGCVIAHVAIAAGAKGAVAGGGGQYEFDKASADDFSATPFGTKMYWDNTNNVATTNAASGANKFLGLSRGTAAVGVTKILIQHVATD